MGSKFKMPGTICVITTNTYNMLYVYLVSD